jgi:ATP-dependent exoDNAse (exonuclease V) beta subunit
MLSNVNNQTKFPEVVVVEASAGSGKTFALAKRYLELLINPRLKLEDIPLRNILAITFTNKATIEMKERILELLKKISLDIFINAEEEKDILSALGVDKKFAQAKAKLIMDEFIRHYNSFQVQTIDSFINSLLVGCALNIERSANFQIKRDYLAYLAYCFDLVIEKAQHDKEVFKFFEEFLEHYLFVENRNSWFPKEDILALMHSLFKLCNKYGRLFETYKGRSAEVIIKKKYIYQLISRFSEKFPQGFNANTQKSILNFIKKNNDIFDISDLPLAFQSKEVPINKNAAIGADIKEEWDNIHKELTELIELDATVAYNPYIKLFRSLLGFFQVVSKKEDVLFLEELNRKARLLFDEGGLTVAEVYYRLATRFKHYLIDEFQDTSVLQWHNLKDMVEDALSAGGSLFYVGDKKQAIYRFRGGEAKLFDEVKDEFLRYNVRPKHLTNNWRSQKAIIDFNNIVFSRDNLLKMFSACGIKEELGRTNYAQEEIIGVFKDAMQTPTPTNNTGYVRIERIEEKQREERDSFIQLKLLSLIKELSQRFNYEDIAILTRDNTEVELASSWLLCNNIPVESEKTLNVIENSLIKEIISLLKFLHSPIDNLSFCAFIFGKIFCTAAKITDREVGEFIFSLHREKKLRGSVFLYHLFRSKYPRIWQDYFNEFFKNIGFISPYELIVNIYGVFEVFKHFKDQQAFFMKFLELVKDKEDECMGIGQFLEYLESAPLDDLYVNATHSDSVKVLTIHKSKGLEFPVVIIPFLRMDINPEATGKGNSSFVTSDVNGNLGLVRITKMHREYSQILQEIYAENYKKACIDELNNIYVAFTRPKYELYIFIPKKSSAINNKAFFLVPEEIKELGRQICYPKSKQVSHQPFINISAPVYKDWIESLSDEFGDALVFLHRQEILEGNIMHSMLSRIANCLNQDIEELHKEAVSFAKAKYLSVGDFSLYEKRLYKMIGKKELKDIFYISQGQVFCEKEIVDKFANSKRIDRLIVKEQEAWVIDYKSSQQAKELQAKQVLEYMEIIKGIYPKHIIKGFLVYLDEMKLEEVKK